MNRRLVVLVGWLCAATTGATSSVSAQSAPASPSSDAAEEDGATQSTPAPTEPAEEDTDPLSAAARAQSVSPTAEGISWEVPISFAQAFNLRGFRRSSQLTYDPTYTWSLSVSPRWNATERLTVGARQDVSLEMTQSDVTSKTRQVWLEDTRLDARYTMRARPGGVSLTWLALLRLPTSLVSQGARRSLNLGGGLLAIRSFDVLSGFVLYGWASYRAWLSSSDVIRTRRRDDFACEQSGFGRSTACEQAGGFTTTIGTFTLIGQALLIPRPRWTLSMALVLDVNHAHRLANACVQVDTSPTPVCLDDGGDHVRTLTELSVSVGYDFRDYLTLTLAYATLANHPDPDGERDSVVWNEQSSLSLTLSFRLGGYVAARRAARAEQAQ
ncbi:MAG: hypothetical protein H6726_17810 [Sandaracinaceae bacterium]|nr:hypothetical protein [Sandaracinaceae bacterium]